MSDILKRFEEAVRRNGELVAIRDQDRTNTRSEFLRDSKRLASALESSLATPIIAFDLPKSIESITLISACLHARVTFVALNPSWPIEKKERILKIAKPDLLVNLRAEPAFETPQRTYADLLESNSGTGSPFDENAIAYTLFTSGSTGDPKGVSISRRALEVFARNIDELLNLEDDKEELLNLAAHSFDQSIQDLMLFFLGKGPLTVLDSDSNPMTVVEVIDKNCITYVSSVGNTYTLLLGFKRWLTPENMATLKVVCSGGSTLYTCTARAWLQRFPNSRLYNLFGPTEATVYVSGARIAEADLDDEPSVHVGKPFAGQGFLYKVDEGFSDAPDGESEMYIYGSQLMERYIGAKEGLIEITWKGSPLTVYPSGDIFKRRGGKDYFLHRKAGFFKSRGYRVSPQEIEEVYLTMDGVIEAAVVGLPDVVKENQIFLFYVGEEEFPKQRFVDFGNTRLAPYSMPHQFRRVDAIPKSSAQKTDYIALRKTLE